MRRWSAFVDCLVLISAGFNIGSEVTENSGWGEWDGNGWSGAEGFWLAIWLSSAIWFTWQRVRDVE